MFYDKDINAACSSQYYGPNNHIIQRAITRSNNERSLLKLSRFRHTSPYSKLGKYAKRTVPHLHVTGAMDGILAGVCSYACRIQYKYFCDAVRVLLDPRLRGGAGRFDVRGEATRQGRKVKKKTDE